MLLCDWHSFATYGSLCLAVILVPFFPVVLYFLYTLFTNLLWFGYLLFIVFYVMVLAGTLPPHTHTHTHRSDASHAHLHAYTRASVHVFHALTRLA